MKKQFLNICLVLMICNIALGESSLPTCEGSDIKDPIKNYLKLRKWTNCIGTGRGLNGEIYVGEFYKGKFHGQGTFTAPNRKYAGQWKNGKKHGQGTYTWINGDKYVGQWKKAKYEGQGTFTYANGDQYTGEWKKSLRHGEGTFTYANGKIDKGIWKRNKLIKSK